MAVGFRSDVLSPFHYHSYSYSYYYYYFLYLVTTATYCQSPFPDYFLQKMSSFPVMRSNLDLRDPEFKSNQANWQPVLDTFEDALKQVSQEGNDVSLRRHQSRGQLLRMVPVLGIMKPVRSNVVNY